MLGLLVAGALVLANAFFVASEFALARLRPTQVTELEAERRPGARSLRHALEHLDAYLAACQLGITVASIGLGVVGEAAFESLLSPLLGPDAQVAGVALAAALAFALITVLHVVAGELAPKSVAISRTLPTALRVAPPMRIVYLATRPLVDVFNGLGNLALRPFGIPPAREVGHAPHSERELLELLAQSGEQGLIEAEERQLAERGFAFTQRTARDVMQPRGAIESVALDTPLEQAARQAAAARHTRLPVGDPERGLDAPWGLLHVHDLLGAVLQGRRGDLRGLLRPLPRVPEDMPVTHLLQRMRDQRGPMVLVAGDAGATVGLVTLEDLLEELVGEIEEETAAAGSYPSTP
ncbi:MAG: hemolysin family protein [Solirubrobacteraceae bacterium]